VTGQDDASLWRRLGRVETDLARQGARLDDVDRRLGDVGRVQERTAAGVDELLRREAARPQPTSWKAAATTVVTLIAGITAVAGFSWWFVATSPAVIELGKQLGELRTAIDKRLTRIDDPEIGRLPRAEKRLDDVERWTPKVVKH
jgi:hypothetical protein